MRPEVQEHFERLGRLLAALYEAAKRDDGVIMKLRMKDGSTVEKELSVQRVEQLVAAWAIFSKVEV